MKFLTLLFVFFTQAALALNEPVVQVSSIYQDQSKSDRHLKVNGSGLIFTFQNRTFVFTASHVSQGNQLKVVWNAKNLEIVGRAMSESSDLELIEVAGVPASEVGAILKDNAIEYPEINGRKRWIDSYNHVPLLVNVNDPGVETDNPFARSRSGVLSLDFFSSLLYGNALVQPGTSGAPLVTTVPSAWKETLLPYDVREVFGTKPAGKSFVRGIAIRRERFFSQAAFVSYARMSSLLDAYLKGQELAPKVQWKAHGALIYRIDEESSLRETVAFASSTAGGTIVDSGNGIIMEGGDLSTLGEDTPKEFLSKVSAFPVSGEEPIMYWMLAMRHPKTSFLINYWSWFDMEFYSTMSKFMFATKQRETSKMDLVSQLYPRFNKRKEFEITQPQYIKVDGVGVFIRLQLPGDKVEFQLNRQGVLCENGSCSERFVPVVEVHSQNGQVYLVDLHRLLFVDTARANTQFLRTPSAASMTDADRTALIYDAIQSEMAKPSVSYRKKRADLTRPMFLSEGIETTVEWKVE